MSPLQLVQCLSSDDDDERPSPVGPEEERSFDSRDRPHQSFDIKVGCEGLLYLEIHKVVFQSHEHTNIICVTEKIYVATRPKKHISRLKRILN